MSKNKEKVLVKKNYYFILNIIIAIVPVIYEIILSIFGLSWGLQVRDETGSVVATSLGVFVKVLLNIIVIGAILWYNIAAERKGETIARADLDKLIEEKEIRHEIYQPQKGVVVEGAEKLPDGMNPINTGVTIYTE